MKNINTCKFCQKNIANKKNTHYFTDFLIRQALNENGSPTREKGLYFDMSNNTLFFEFNFQRNTSINSLEEILGRQPNEEEIKNAKAIPFSVDNVFCSDCENFFTQIETDFKEKVFPKFLNNDSSNIIIKENDILRLFFYLQIWRTHICDEGFNISGDVAEDLRNLLKNHKEFDSKQIRKYPMCITFLETRETDKNFTENLVGVSNRKNPYLLFLNNFIVQFYERNENSFKYYSFYGINKKEEFRKNINVHESDFQINFLSNKERIKFNNEYQLNEIIKPLINNYKIFFTRLWEQSKGYTPSEELVLEFLKILSSDNSELKLSKQRVIEKILKFMQNKV